MDADSELATSTMRRVAVRILPFVFLLYIVSYIDRANISFAALTMNAEIGISGEVFGFAAGLFFIGYFLFEVPSNVVLLRVGARRWIARIMITWGIVSILLGFVQNGWQLGTLRFLLGVAEAGFFPGIIVYLGGWFRRRELAGTIGMFTASIPIAGLISSPLSTAIIQYVGWLGLSGWRWVFIFEGIPAVLLGGLCYLFLTEKPGDAHWLTPDQRDWLVQELAGDQAAAPGVLHLTVLETLRNARVVYLCVAYFCFQVGFIGVGYWLPQILRDLSSDLTPFQIGLIGMLPYLVAAVAMVTWARHSDRQGDAKAHCYLAVGLAAVMMFVSGLVSSPALAIITITCTLAGLYSFLPPFWTVPRIFLTVTTAGTAIAAINSVGSLGGFVGPYALGLLRQASGSNFAGLAFLAFMLAIATLMIALMKVTPDSTAD